MYPMGTSTGDRLGRVETWAAGIAGLGVLLMMIIGGADVVLTKFFSLPIPGAYEVTEALMVSAIFLALAQSQREGRQIRVELITERLDPSRRLFFHAFAEICSFALYGLIAWYGIESAWESVRMGEFTSGLAKLPIWPAKAMLAIGASLMCAECMRGALHAVRSALSGRN